MTKKVRLWFWNFLVAAGLALFAWALVAGVAITHPESGVPETAAKPALLVVFVLALAYYGARSVMGGRNRQ
jgi:hypothetical protein